MENQDNVITSLFKKYWGIITAVIGACIGIFGFVFNFGVSTSELENRTFDTVKQKVEVVKYVEESPTPKELARQFYRDSMDTVNRTKSRKTRDSLMILEFKARKITDSINRLNADQLFQIKEELKKIRRQ